MATQQVVLLIEPKGEAAMSRSRSLARCGGTRPVLNTVFAGVVLLVAVLRPALVAGEPVAVRHTEGIVHGFLVLRTLEGKALADGDLLQSARGDRVSTRLVFRFKDGSTHEESAVYTQRQRFQFVSGHLVQKGPAFPQPLEMTINGATGQVVVRYTNDHGEQKVEDEHVDIPPDLANGMILTLLKNVQSNALPKSISMIAATPKPRLVKLELSAAGQERFATGGAGRTATHYVVKVDIGGLSGLIAPLVGKQPPDSHVWILGGEAPAFVKSEQPFFMGGPLWRIELASPVWPRTAAAGK
jgi:hypothetical protein